jgi:hypothetical protein
MQQVSLKNRDLGAAVSASRAPDPVCRWSPMKYAGLFLLMAGWLVVLAALALFAQPLPRSSFVAAGLILEVAGLALALRGHSLGGHRNA